MEHSAIPTRELVPILYVLVRPVRSRGATTPYHLVDGLELHYSTLFQILPLLPGSVEQLYPARLVFSEAVERVRRVPQFRQMEVNATPDKRQIKIFLDSPLLVLLINEELPAWVPELATKKPLVLISSDLATLDATKGHKGIYAADISGHNKIENIYQSFASLLQSDSSLVGPSDYGKSAFSTLRPRSLFSNRSKINFIPRQKIPGPSFGRSSAFLLNRLSNKTDAITFTDEQFGPGSIADLFHEVKLACGIFALLEQGMPTTNKGVNFSEIKATHQLLLSDVPDSQKWELLTGLAARMEKFGPRGPYFFSIPSIRPQAIKLKLPGLTYPNLLRSRNAPNVQISDQAKSVRDFCNASSKAPGVVSNDPHADNSTLHILQLEQEAVALQTTMLAGGLFSTPVMTHPSLGSIFQSINNLHLSLAYQSPKSAKMFDSLQRELANLLPEGVSDLISEKDREVIFYSDLPFEWAMFNGTALCLQKPVTRIPISHCNWSMIATILQDKSSINSRKPQGVLILDMLEEGDPLKARYKQFRNTFANRGLDFKYASPRSPEELDRVLSESRPEIVVWDGHGKFDARQDRLFMTTGSKVFDADELFSNTLMPRVWVLSACETSMTAAVRGCLSRKLIARGALSVIATSARVYADVAFFFIEQLLAGIYLERAQSTHLQEVFFRSQIVTSSFYDPLLPLFRKCKRDWTLRTRVKEVMQEFTTWVGNESKGLGPLEFREAASLKLDDALARQNLLYLQRNLRASGQEFPESLMFTSIGAAANIQLIY